MSRIWIRPGNITKTTRARRSRSVSNASSLPASDMLSVAYLKVASGGYDSAIDEVYASGFSDGEVYLGRAIFQQISNAVMGGIAVSLRASAIIESDQGLYELGYRMAIERQQYGDARYGIWRGACSGNPVGGTQLGVVAGGSADMSLRGRAVSTALKLRAWNYGSAEPGTWGIEVTDASYSTGSIILWTRIAASYSAATTGRASSRVGLGIDFGGTNAPTAGGLATISGNVKRDGSNQAGATVCLVRTTAVTTDRLIPGIDMMKATTDANGAFSFSLDTDDTGPYAISASYKSGTVWYQGAVVAEAGDSGLVIEIHPAHVTRARYKGAWYTDVWDKVGGLWVKR